MSDEAQLSQRIQALPQELQDLIFDTYIETERDTEVTITKDWKPLVQQQLNKHYRKQTMTTYYGTNTFIVSPGLSTTHLARWVARLESRNLAIIPMMRIQTLFEYMPNWQGNQSTRARCKPLLRKLGDRTSFLRLCLGRESKIEVEIPRINNNGEIVPEWFSEEDMRFLVMFHG